MKRSLPLFSANLLFALTMLLVITAGSLVQTANLSYGLIATEAFLIGLPTLVFLRYHKVPLKEGLRLNPLSLRGAVLAVLLGVCTWFFTIIIEGIMSSLTGMKSVDIPEGMMPKGAVEMVAYFIALAVFAPLCEEILFRGAVQGAYESKKSARFAITITALMFAFYHYRLSGLPGLIPVAFILGWVVWRTQSIYAGMLIHFGMNGTAAINSLYYLSTGQPLPILTNPAILLGLATLGMVGTVVILRLFKHLYPAPEQPAPAALPARAFAKQPGWLSVYWPLFIAGALYTGIAGITLAASLGGGSLASSKLDYNLPVVHGTSQYSYRFTNRAGDEVGQMDCILTAHEDSFEVNCNRRTQAYEIKVGQSSYSEANHTAVLHMKWDGKTLDLLEYSLAKEYENGLKQRWELSGGQLTADNGGTVSVDVPAGALLEYEWAFRGALLKGGPFSSRQIKFLNLAVWDNDKKETRPTVKDFFAVTSPEEELKLPSGKVMSRRLTVGSLTGGLSAWYRLDDLDAHLPIPAKFEDDMGIYSLVK